MENQTIQADKNTLTSFIQKQITIFGPDIALKKVKKIDTLTVSDDGSVTNVTGDIENVLKQLADQFKELSPFVLRQTMTNLMYTRSSSQNINPSPSSPSLLPSSSAHNDGTQ